MAVITSALVLAGLESTKLLLNLIPSYDQKQKKLFEVDYEIYTIQKTMPGDHPDLNDSLFLRVRNRLLQHVQKINAAARSNG